MASEAVAGWEEFHQKEELTTRLKNILDEYPPGIGTFKEFLQNADDAGAERFSVILDLRSHSRDKRGLLTPQLAEWQGPAVLFHNSSTFSDDDFKSISSLGNSVKFNDTGKIGKYGLGVNVAYHFTDVVSFISRDQIIFFDPHGTHLPRKVLGLRTNFVEQAWMEKYPAQMSPYVLPEIGSTMKGSFEGTLFRLPLRTLGRESKISSHTYDAPELRTVLRDFLEQAPQLLIFLQHVQDIRVLVRDDAGTLEIGHVSLANVSDELRKSRWVLKRPVTDESLFELKIESKVRLEPSEGQQPLSGSLQTSTETWAVFSSPCAPGAEALAEKLKCPRFASAATRLSSSHGTEQQVAGRAYCFLPLPFTTGLPIHINASFALSSNRRNLWTAENELEGDGTLKAKWNQHLLRFTLPQLYARFLYMLRKRLDISPATLIQLWPTPQTAATQFKPMTCDTLLCIKETGYPLFFDDVSGNWHPLGDVIFDDPKHPCSAILRQGLRERNVKVVDPPSVIKESLAAAEISVKTANYQVVTDAFRQKSPAKVTLANELLVYVLNSEFLDAAHYKALHGIRAIPLINGRLAMFSKPLSGSSAGHAHHRQHQDDFQAAGKGSGKKGSKAKDKDADGDGAESEAVSECFICSDLEVGRLLFSHCSSLVDPETPVFDKLCTQRCFQTTNIAPMNIAAVLNLMPYILPASWEGRNSVPMEFLERAERGGNLADESDGTLALSGRKQKALAKKVARQVRRARSSDRQSDFESLEELRATLRALWIFLEQNAQVDTILTELSDWPLVPVNGFVVTIEYACSRKVLHGADFSERERSILERFGVLFSLLTSTPEDKRALAKLCLCLETSNRRYAIHALQASHASTKGVNPGICRELRDLLVEWLHDDANDTMFSQSRDQLRDLPIFETLSGREFLTGEAMSCPNDQGTNVYSETSSWDEIMTRLFPNDLITFRGIPQQALLKAAKVRRSSQMDFLSIFLAPRLTHEDIPKDLILQCLELIGEEMGIDRNRNTDSARFLVRTLKSARIVVKPSGERCAASEFLDSTVPLLQALFKEEIERGTAPDLFPPPEYCTPNIIRFLRMLGLEEPSNAACFLRLLNMTVTLPASRRAQLSEPLLRFLMETPIVPSWPLAERNSISRVPFIAAQNFRQLSIAEACFGRQPHLAKAQQEILTPKQQGGKARAPKERRKQGRNERNAMSSYMAMAEEELGLDFEDDLAYVDVREGIGRKADIKLDAEEAVLDAVTGLAEALEMYGKDYARQPMHAHSARPHETPSFVSLRENGASLYADFWIAWTANSSFFPLRLDNAPFDFLDTFSIPAWSPGFLIIQHIRNIVDLGLKEERKDRGFIAIFQSIIRLCLAHLGRLLAVRSLSPDRLKLVLADTPLVLCDDGTFLLASEICVDLEEDLNPRLRATPPYLKQLEGLLRLIGSPSTTGRKAPKVQVRSKNTAVLLPSMITSLVNSATLSDVVFTCGDRSFRAHKLVLGLVSEFFRSMFTSGMKEETQALLVIPLDDWVDPDAFLMLLQYMYTGSLDGDDNASLETPTERTCQLVCNLLQLADMYFLEHLREFCELYLSDSRIVGLYNICDLLTHAVGCHAPQLEEVCIFHIKEMLNVVVKMEEWGHLAPELQARILGRDVKDL